MSKRLIDATFGLVIAAGILGGYKLGYLRGLRQGVRDAFPAGHHQGAAAACEAVNFYIGSNFCRYMTNMPPLSAPKPETKGNRPSIL